MKTRFPRLSSVVAAVLLSLGFARAAQAFDLIAYGQAPSESAAEAAGNCTSSCYYTEMR